MALANLFSSPPGEVDFDKIVTKTRSEQPHHNRKPTGSTPKNENFNKKRNRKKRKRGQPTDSTWTRCEFPNKKKFHAVSLEYEDQTVDNQKPSQHGKRANATALSSPSDRLGVNAAGGWKNESNGNGDGGNRRQHYNNNKHRRNPNGPNIQEGQSRHGGKNVTFQEKKHLNATNKHQRNAFHQGPGAGGKKGRQQPRMQRSRPKWEERKPFMTPEFKEQNSIDVNGRLICKHFLADRCLKGEGCQFEHSRDLGGFKFHEVCKFYIQGFCMRGDSCLYMHNAFPCKFFHRGRGCQNQDSCRFSHAPLTELTGRILDKFLEELKAKHQQLEPEPEPEPEPAADPLANTKTCEDFLANTKTLNFYSAAENSEPEPVRPFSFGANSAEFQPERPVSVLIPVPIAVTISQQPTQSADHTDSPVQSGAASASESQTPLVEQGPVEQPERPTASNSTARPSSSSSTPSASSSSSSTSKDAENLFRATAIERPQSPRTPDPPSTPSVLRNLFSHLSPCRSDYDNDDDDDSGNIDGEEDEMTVKMKTELEGDATSNSTDPVPLLDATKFCTEVPREHGGAGSHSKVSTPAAPDHQLGLMTNPLPKSRNLVKEPQRHEHLVVPPPSKPPVPCSTPIASHLRKYRPLTVDLSPLPSLSLTAYHQTPRPHDATPGHLTSVADTQEAAPQQCVARSQGAGIKKTLTGELQGRHSLPVQSLSWANSSKCKDQKRR